MPIAIMFGVTIAVGATMMTSGLPADAEVTEVQLVKAYPHDQASFCQGLVVFNGALLEGTGQYERSRLRLVDMESGVPSIDIPLANNVFGEGVTVWQNTILQLTWKNGYLITYDASTFRQTGTVPLNKIDRSLAEGWGITHDGKHLIISDGSAVLRFVDPSTYRLIKRVHVKDGRRAVTNLNELEFVNGEVFANVWYKDQIARIDPNTGKVNSWLNLAPLRPAVVRNDKEAVLNGIAWDADKKRLFVTGKNWPALYEVSF